LTCGYRIKELRKHLGLSQDDFANKIKITHGHVSTMENGKKEVSDKIIAIICLTFGVREEWLRNGNGEMFAEITKDEEIAAFMGDALSDEDDTFKKRFLSMLSRLGTDEWELLEKMAKELVKEND